MRWSHDGVRLRSPIRSARSLRHTVWAVLAFCGFLNLLWFLAIAPPPPSAGYERCLVSAERDSPLCETLRPSWMTWSHDEASWTAARACTVASDELAPLRLANVVAARGIQSVPNLDFLQMVRAQEGVCELPATEARLVQREYEELRALEAAVWAARVERAIASEASWIAVRATWHDVGQRFLPLWMPALLLGWLVALVATRRILRYAAPIELDVNAAGVRIDGRVIPRSTIAYLTIEGRRLRIERWLGPPVYSRPLPPEALANADEICGAMTVWDDETEPPDRQRHRVALDRLVRAT